MCAHLSRVCLAGDSDFDINQVCLKIDNEALGEARRAHDNAKTSSGKGAGNGKGKRFRKTFGVSLFVLIAQRLCFGASPLQGSLRSLLRITTGKARARANARASHVVGNSRGMGGPRTHGESGSRSTQAKFGPAGLHE